MGIFTKPVVTASVSSSGVAPPAISHKPKLRMHKKGNSSVTSVTLLGESYWRSKAPKLVSLEVASQTPSIIKRGFEYMYHKTHEYRLTGGSLYFGPVSSLVRKSQRDVPGPPHGDSDGTSSLLPVAPISSGKHDNTAGVDVYGDSTKQVLEAASLISLGEAKQREASRRNRAAKRALEEKTQVEREVRRLEREVAEITWKKAQARRLEEERLAHLSKESREKEAVEALEQRKREEGPTLTAAVAAREDGLVVAPTNWIVPLISLDEARHTEKAKREAVDKSKPPLPLSPPPPPPAAASDVDSLMINAGNGGTATLELISLEEAAKRDRARRLEEDALRSRSRMLAQAGTGLSHVPLIPLAEARKQDALRRKDGSSQDRNKAKSPGSVSRPRKSSHPSPPSPVNRTIEKGNGDGRVSSKDAYSAHEKARWLALMSDAGNRWTRPDTASHFARTPTATPDWV